MEVKIIGTFKMNNLEVEDEYNKVWAAAHGTRIFIYTNPETFKVLCDYRINTYKISKTPIIAYEKFTDKEVIKKFKKKGLIKKIPWNGHRWNARIIGYLFLNKSDMLPSFIDYYEINEGRYLLLMCSVRERYMHILRLFLIPSNKNIIKKLNKKLDIQEIVGPDVPTDKIIAL